MDSGFYAASTALAARTEALDTIANNLANAGTRGFRARHNSFSSVLAAHTPYTALNQATNNYGVLGGTRIDLSQGQLETTGNPMDVAIEGPGFFKVQTAGGTAYTREGAFRISPKGQLTTAAGDAVIGEGGTISLVGSGPVTISPDGTVTSGGAVVGRLVVVDFPPGTGIESRGGNYLGAPAKSEVPARDAQLRQGMLEGSNVNPVSSVVELITAQREAEGMRHALTMFSSEMDKTAAQDLPRVG